MKCIDELELSGKTVFIRADLNVPLTDTCEVADDTRIRASIPTIECALKAGAKVVLASHLGRPKGERKPDMSLAPVAKKLGELVDAEIIFADDCIGDAVQAQVAALQPGQVLLLENLRYYNEEEKNDPEFAKQLAALADVYVNDAFATAHRAHASTAGMVPHFEQAAAGFTIKNEIAYFNKALANPERPLLIVFGGAKVSTKMDAIRNAGPNADAVIIGGAMANTFFAAQGHNVGKSLYEPEEVDNAREITTLLEKAGTKVLLPTDVITAAEFKGGIPTKTVAIDAIGAEEMALDIGPASAEAFAEAIASAKTIVWNGPMGAFEIDEYSGGTYAVVDAMIAAPGLTVVGGGDTDLALHKKHAVDKMDYVSTAGGAFLELLEGKKLPGIVALGG